jgi:hypothetical protein
MGRTEKDQPRSGGTRKPGRVAQPSARTTYEVGAPSFACFSRRVGGRRGWKPNPSAASQPTLAKNARMGHPHFVMGKKEQSVEKAGPPPCVSCAGEIKNLGHPP